MTTSSSARRSPPRAQGTASSGKLIPYGIFGLGCLLVVLGFGTQLTGDRVLYQTLSPEQAGTGVVYTSKQVELKEGLHDFRLKVRDISAILNIVGFPYSLSSPEHPDWHHSGSLRVRSSKSRSSVTRTRRSRAEDTLLIKIEEPGTYTLVATFDADLNHSLDLSVTKVYADYRIPLFLGIGLAVLGGLMSPELRAALTRINWRFGR